MTIEELMKLIAAADFKQKGCTVEFTTIYKPSLGKSDMLGVITYGMDEGARTFHTEKELRTLLKRIG